MGTVRAEESFEMIDKHFLQHQRPKFTPLSTADGEIHLDELGIV